MALPRRTPSSWVQNLEDLPNQLFGTGSDDFELYEEEDEFVLTVEMPGFDTEDISLAWDKGVLNIAAKYEDDERSRRRTYNRRFRFPKRVDDDAIEAEYTNGILEVRLPVATGQATGREIEVN
jgi:HSP20 family protein